MNEFVKLCSLPINSRKLPFFGAYIGFVNLPQATHLQTLSQARENAKESLKQKRLGSNLMKYLFTTVTYEIDTISLETILDTFFSKKQTCSVYAAGRLGFEIAAVKYGILIKKKTGYNYGSISINENRNGIKYSVLIFSNKKVKLSMGFPESEFVFQDYIETQIKYYSDLMNSNYSNMKIHNITLQKQSDKILLKKLDKKIKDYSHLFSRIVLPDTDLGLGFYSYRCYLNHTNCHLCLDNKGHYQILGAKSEEDVLALEKKLNFIITDIAIDELL